MKIIIYKNIQDMTGIGEEWLVDAQDDVIAVFINGNLACKILKLRFQDDITNIIKNA